MKYKNPNIESSYRKNDLGQTFFDLVLEKQPKVILEWGVLNGYSTVAMAMALDELGSGHITAYDLFDGYKYKSSTIENTQKNIDRYDVSKYVTCKKGDFNSWIEKMEHFDLLHVDISNNGETIAQLYEACRDRIENGATVIFEGGAPGERDEVPWMVKYKFPKIKDSKVPYKILNTSFPSLSMLTFRHDN